MRKSAMQNFLQGGARLIFTIAALCCLIGQTARAQADGKTAKNAAKRAQQAARVFDEVMEKNDRSIPRELLERAEAVAIFPGVIKAAFIVGGRGGEGVIARRTPAGWSAPAFFKIGGGSFGAQIGADKTDYILLIMNDGGLKGLLEDKFQFGGEAGVAAGPVGRTASAETTATLDAGILSYSRSQGAFIGAALTGAVVTPDKDKNAVIYGKTAKEILSANNETANAMPDSVKVLPEALSRYSSRRGSAANSSTESQNRTDRTPASATSRVRISGAAGADNSKTSSPETASPVAAFNKIYRVSRTPRREREPRASDKLAAEIKLELLMLPSYGVFDWLEFEITGENVVILRGQATRPELKTEAQKSVENVEGVARVQNEVEVLPVSQADERLRESLYRSIYSGELARYAVGAVNPIHIIVKNGGVTLKGVVNSDAENNRAHAQANAVTGGVKVRGELWVDADEPQP